MSSVIDEYNMSENNWKISDETIKFLKNGLVKQTDEDRQGQFTDIDPLPNIEIISVEHLPENKTYKITWKEI